MGQEYFINSQELETKVRTLLPSQGGAGAGVDLSASTQIVPIIDLTESAEGSNVRADLQTALSHDTCTEFNVNNTATTVISNTGYFRVIGSIGYRSGDVTACLGEIIINDGTTDKTVFGYRQSSTSSSLSDDSLAFDFNVFLKAGDSLIVKSSQSVLFIIGSVRQIADIDGNLINP